MTHLPSCGGGGIPRETTVSDSQEDSTLVSVPHTATKSVSKSNNRSLYIVVSVYYS